MKCPFCDRDELEVLESRSVGGGKVIRRRRSCKHCCKRFTTHERIDQSLLWVIKKDGRREPYDQEKMRRGIMRAIEKRPISLELVDDTVRKVELSLLKRKSHEVSSRAIGGLVLRALKRIDRVAWLRFASVYMEFEDLDDFLKAIK